MFAGHYSASFVARSADPRIPLWVLFVAVQLVDIAFFVLVPLGIEKLRVIDGFTTSSPLDLHYMPYTHGLTSALLWAAAAALAYRYLGSRRSWSAALIVGAAVLSHWFLDLAVHTPDLPLHMNQHKVGLGLWQQHVAWTLALELGLLAASMRLYVRRTGPLSPAARLRLGVIAAVLVGLELFFYLGPVIPYPMIITLMAQTSFLGLSVLAYRLDAARAGDTTSA